MARRYCARSTSLLLFCSKSSITCFSSRKEASPYTLEVCWLLSPSPPLPPLPTNPQCWMASVNILIIYLFSFIEIGEHSATLIRYLECNGASQCPPGANPAEWMLAVIGAAPGSQTTVDWPKAWRDSPEYQSVKSKLHEIQTSRATTGSKLKTGSSNQSNTGSYAAPFLQQWWFVQKRVAAQYWRTPTYIYSKVALTVFSVGITQTKKILGCCANISFADCFTFVEGSIHRFQLFQGAEYHPRPPEPDVRCDDAIQYVWAAQ